MDTFFPSPTAAHGEPTTTGVRLLSPTMPMTAKERDTLRALARAARMIADNVEDAVRSNRVDLGLEACSRAGELGEVGARAAALLGGAR